MAKQRRGSWSDALCSEISIGAEIGDHFHIHCGPLLCNDSWNKQEGSSRRHKGSKQGWTLSRVKTSGDKVHSLHSFY